MSPTPEAAAASSPTRCGRCNRESDWAAAFTQVPSWGGPRLYCPRCIERRNTRRTHRTWAWAFATLTLVPFAVALDLLPGMMWATVGWAAVLFAMYVSVLPHELGHALMARAVGYRPLAIVWGGFPSVFDGRILGVRTVIGLAPESGFTCFDPVDDRWPRLKQFLITAAGPLVNLLLGALAVGLAIRLDVSARASATKFVLLAFGAANLILAAVNLWPHRVSTVVGRMASDGSRLLSMFRWRAPELAVQRTAACQVRLFFAFRDRDYDRVLAEAQRAEELMGAAPWIDVARSAALCSLGEPHQARELLLRTLGMPTLETDPGTRALAQNNLAWALFLIDDPALDADSLEWSRRAMATAPWIAALVNTRACVLAAHAEPGSPRLAEARALLSRIQDLEQSDPVLHASTLAAGLIAAAEKDFDAAGEHWEALRQFDLRGSAERVLEARIPSR